MIIPAIDLIGGRVTRLAQGDFERQTGYDSDPRDLIQSYADAGASLVHIVDLDGARDPKTNQSVLIKQLLNESPVALQVGGGIRSMEDACKWLKESNARIVIGSMAVKEPATIVTLIEEFGADRLCVSIDVSLDSSGNPQVMTHGWKQASGRMLAEVLAPLVEGGLIHVLCTDIARDGVGSGCNEALYAKLVQEWPSIQWQASGGIGSLEDVSKAKASGAQHLIIGKALLDGRFDAKEAIACWQNG